MLNSGKKNSRFARQKKYSDISFITQDTVFLSLTEFIFDIVYIVPVVETNLLAFCVLSRLAFWWGLSIEITKCQSRQASRKSINGDNKTVNLDKPPGSLSMVDFLEACLDWHLVISIDSPPRVFYVHHWSSSLILAKTFFSPWESFF
jgi:hypothetical protein